MFPLFLNIYNAILNFNMNIDIFSTKTFISYIYTQTLCIL